MPYVDRQNRICGFLDIEDNENSGKFLRRYFILDTQANCLLWYMDNPQNLAVGAGAVGSLQLTYISKVSIATPKQKPKTPFCFVINALSQRYFLQANDQKDLKDWVEALNQASKITVPKAGTLPLATEVLRSLTAPPTLDKKPQVAYKTEIIGGVVVQTPISQNGGDGQEGSEPGSHAFLRRSQSYIPTSGCRPPTGPPLIKSGYCVKQGNVRKSWKRRFFALDDFTICYFKCEQDREPLRTILLKDVLKTHECLVKSGKLPSEFMVREVIQDLTRQCPIPSPKYSWTTKHTLLCLGTVHQLMDGKVDTISVLHAIVSDAVMAGGVQVSPRDLLMRDNLFEIITTSRTFYVQADSPEDMRSWIQEIGAAVQALKCHPREPSFSRSVSLTRPGSSSLASGPNFILRRRPAVEEKRALCKAPSVASSWQPWTPVPQAGEKPLSAENAPEDSLFLPHPGESNATGVLASSRVRHRSEPQHPKEKPFVFNLDDENIRTSDV